MDRTVTIAGCLLALAVLAGPAQAEMVLSGTPQSWPPSRVVYMGDRPFAECGELDDRAMQQSCIAQRLNEGTQLPQLRKDRLREEAMPHPARPSIDPARPTVDPSRPTVDPSRTTPPPR